MRGTGTLTGLAAALATVLVVGVVAAHTLTGGDGDPGVPIAMATADQHEHGEESLGALMHRNEEHFASLTRTAQAATQTLPK